MGELFRALFLVLLWLLLVGSGLCVAISAVSALAMANWSVAIVSLVATGVGTACWFAIQALKKHEKAATPLAGPDEPS